MQLLPGLNISGYSVKLTPSNARQGLAMRDILDLEAYPLDKPGTPQWLKLVEKCRADLASAGMYNLADPQPLTAPWTKSNQ
jgi:hypothetical protein